MGDRVLTEIPTSGGKVPPDVRHPSGFASWQDLRGYLLDYNIIARDDETCRLIEEAYSRWPNNARLAEDVAQAIRAAELRGSVQAHARLIRQRSRTSDRARRGLPT